jgi:hypothetical protein
MTFVSIIRLLDYCNIDYSDLEQLNIPRIKKQIAAEFNFAPQGFIPIEEHIYNKNEVFQTLDAANAKELISYHLSVYEHKTLLQLLEKGHAENIVPQDISSFVHHEGFVRFISPYFAPVYNREMKHRLATAGFERAADWIPFCRLLLTTDGEKAFQSTTAYLEEALRLFRNLNKETFFSRREEVLPWTHPFGRFLNWLPDMLYPQKEALAIQLINFCVEIQEADRAICYKISNSMLELNFLDSFHTKLIRDNHLVYESRVVNTNTIPPEREQELKKEKSKGANYIWFIIAAIVFVVKMVSKCDNDNHRTFQTVDYDYSTEVRKEQYQSFFDELRSYTPNPGENYEHENYTQVGDLKSYFSFLNPAGETLEPYIIKFHNKTPETLELHYLHQGYVYVLPLAAGKYITLEKPEGDHIDFILQKSGTSYSYTKGSVNNLFFLIETNKKNWNPLYFGKPLRSGYVFNSKDNPDSIKLLETVITLKDHTLYIESQDMKLLKTVHR